MLTHTDTHTHTHVRAHAHAHTCTLRRREREMEGEKECGGRIEGQRERIFDVVFSITPTKTRAIYEP